MTPLPSRISQAIWAVEWPSGAEFGTGTPLARQSIPHNLEWPWDRAQGVLAALSGAGEPVQLDVAHQFLDGLETWTRNNRALLTWPPTAQGFANALVHSARTNDVGVVAVLAAYPDFCHQMMEQAREVDPSLPSLSGLFGRQAPARRYEARPSAPPAGAPQATAPEAEAPAPVSSPVAAERPARPERAPRPAPTPPAPFVLEWVDAIKKESQPALARQMLDQQLKSTLSANKGNAWTWFDRTVFPELVKLPVEDLELLLNTWPAHNRFTPEAPAEWVDQTRFWVLMRDAGPERREVFASGGLANVVNLERTDAATRFDMATKMFPFASKKAELFRQRLRLWQSFGGDLDEPVAVDAGDVDLSSASKAAQTVRQWVEEQNDPEWDGVLQKMTQESVSESRFRRSGPR